MPQLDVLGGLRARLIRDSYFEMLRGCLAELGWFDTVSVIAGDGGRQHRSVRLIAKPLEWDEAVEPNLIAVSTSETESQDVELGSDLAETKIPFFVDIYAESESLGLDLAGDVRDITRGRMPGLGRVRPSFHVYDFRMPTPSAVGMCLVESVDSSEQETRVERAWLSNWYTISFTAIDLYRPTVDEDLEVVGNYPAPDNWPGPNNFPWGSIPL